MALIGRSRLAVGLVALIAVNIIVGCSKAPPAPTQADQTAAKADEAEKGRTNTDMPGGGPPGK